MKQEKNKKKKSESKKEIMLLFLVVSLLLVPMINASINLEKTEYEQGEQVMFFVEGEETDKLEIIHPDRVFKLIGNVEGEHRFYPENGGEYLIQLINKENEVKTAKTFYVKENYELIQNAYFKTNKKEYKIGEEVIIELIENIDITKATISFQNIEYSFMGKPEFPLSFYPDKIGTYTIILEDTEKKKYEATFETKLITSYQEHRVFGSHKTKPLQITDSKGKLQDIKIEYKEIINLARGTAIKEIEEENLERNKEYDVEITKKQQRISIKGYKYEENKNIIFEETRNKKINEKNSNIFLINIDLEFEEATFKNVAKGTELIKCEEWNFEEQKCEENWEKIQELIPGEEYEVTITSGTNTYAETGVASINTKKSMYKTGEIAEIIIVVLDKDGYLVPEAEVEVNVTTPNNKTLTYTTKNNTVIGGEQGVYYANHTTEEEGRYELSVRAEGREVKDSMKSYFIVLEEYDFDIIRETPVTIDPFQGPFESRIKITSLKETETFNFTEVLPISFKVQNYEPATKTTDEENVYLTWHNIKNDTEIKYEFNSPFIIPYLWELGPSIVTYEEQGETRTFTEARPWYLAIDPITYYDPSSDITTEWSSGTGTSYTQIVKTTRQPTAPTISTYVASQRRSNQISEFGFSSITETGIEEITLWVYTSTGGTSTYTFSLRRGTTTLCSNTVPTDTSLSWRSCSWEPNGDLSGLSIHLSAVTGAGGPSNAFVYAAYLEVDTGTPPPEVTLNAPAPNAIMTSTPINFNFTSTDSTYTTMTCRLYTNTTGTWEINTTLTNVQNNTQTSTSLSPSDGVYNWNVECENQDEKSAFAENNRTVYVNTNAPLIQNEALNETTIRQNRTLHFNATITDSFGISTATISVTYPNSSVIEHELQNNDDEYYYEFTNTLEEGIYNVTKIWANDTLGQSNEKNTNLWFEVQAIQPTTFDLISPENATESRELTPTLTWEETTTPDFKNYTIILDKDPNFGSPDYIYTMTSISNTNYTVDLALDANNVYYWKVIAYDVFENSKESTNYFKYINDRINPTVTLNNPANNHFASNDEVTFSYTPNDANTLDYCELLTNETGTMEVRQTNNTITNNQLNYFTRTLPEGPITWNVRCYDEATNQGSGTQRQVTVDTTGPVITLISPEDDALIDDTNFVTFTANAYDELSSVNYCELIVNGSVEETNTEITDNINFNFSTFLNNNYYEWNVRCYDDLGNDETSESRYLTVESLDNDPPIITLINPVNNRYLNTSTTFFEYLVEDATGIDSCSLYIDGDFEEENTNIINFEKNNFTISLLTEKKYNWSITCTDNSSESNTGYSTTRHFTIDLTNPEITLNSPINNSFLNYDNINFEYTPTDTNLHYCELHTNFTGNFEATANHTNPTSGEINIFNVNSPSGIFVWNVKCHDLSKRKNFAEQNFTLSVDVEAPKYSEININPLTPAIYENNKKYYFNITWTDNFEIDTVILEHNFTGIISEETLQGINDVYNFSIQNLNSGTYYYKWYTNDTSGNENETTIYSYVINKAEPTINLYLNSVQDNITINENNDVLIEGEVIILGDGYIELYLNNELINKGTGSVNNNTYFSEPGEYNITMIFNETLNYLKKQKTFFITVNDITPPNITLISPTNNTLLATGSRNLIYNVNDSSNILNCSLYINDELNQTSTNITKNTQQSFTINTEEETYNWRIQCFDEYENEGTSETRTFTAVSDETINVYVNTEKTWEQGEPAIIKINTTDAFGNTLQTQITNYIITGETNTPWWNTNWKKRQQLIINEETGTNQENILIGINITGLNNIQSCENELRIIKHEDATKTIIPRRIYYTDNSEWCYFVFYGNLTANEENKEYYAYYNNSGASNPNYNVDVTTHTLFNARESGADEGTPTSVANIIGKNDDTYAEMTQGGGGGTHSAHGRAFINETFGPIQKVEVSYRYQVPASSGTWSLRYSVNDGADYSSLASGTTTQTKQTSSWYDITNIYSEITWTELNRTRLQGHVTKTRGGSITMYLFWVEMNVTHYKNPEVIATNNSEEELKNSETQSTDSTGYLEVTWNTKDIELGTYSAVSLATADTYNDATNNYTFNVTPDATPPNVTLISPEDWFESGKGNFDFSYYVFDYNLDYCTLFIGNISETLNEITTNNNPTNDETNTFENIFVDIGVYEWNVRCHDEENNSAFATSNYVLNISAPDLVVRSEDIWFEYTQLIEGTTYTIFANITNEGLSPAEEEFNVSFYLQNPATGGELIGTSTITSLASLETKTVNTTHNLIIGPNNIYVLVDEKNVINETDLTNNKANNTLNLELYQYYYGNTTSDIVLAKSDYSLFLGYPNNTGIKGHVFFADADSEISFQDLQAITRNTDGNLVAGDFSAIDEVMNTTHLSDSIRRTWGGGTETPLQTRTFNVSSGIIHNVPVVPSTEYEDFVTGILWDTSQDTGNLRYDSADKEVIVFITELNHAKQGKYGVYDFEIRVPATLREYSGENNKLAFYFELN